MHTRCACAHLRAPLPRRAGCQTVLTNLLLRVSTLALAPAVPPGSGASLQAPSSPARLLSLAPSFSVDAGGLLVLSNVTIVSSSMSELYGGLCSMWSFSASAQLNAAGELHLAGEHATTSGLLLRDVAILPSPELQVVATQGAVPTPDADADVGAGEEVTDAPAMALSRPAQPPVSGSETLTAVAVPALTSAGRASDGASNSSPVVTLPCRATTASDADTLNALLLSALVPLQPLHISLAANITIDPAAWQPVAVGKEASFSLLGDPAHVTQIDFGGMPGLLYPAGGVLQVSKSGVVRMTDVVIINALAWDAPTSVLSALASLVQPVLTRRVPGKLLGNTLFQPQVALLRCTLFVARDEVEWMRYALPPMWNYTAAQAPLRGAWFWIAQNYAFTFKTIKVQVGPAAQHLHRTDHHHPPSRTHWLLHGEGMTHSAILRDVLLGQPPHLPLSQKSQNASRIVAAGRAEAYMHICA